MTESETKNKQNLLKRMVNWLIKTSKGCTKSCADDCTDCPFSTDGEYSFTIKKRENNTS